MRGLALLKSLFFLLLCKEIIFWIAILHRLLLLDREETLLVLGKFDDLIVSFLFFLRGELFEFFGESN